jgi:hypothetical protein
MDFVNNFITQLTTLLLTHNNLLSANTIYSTVTDLAKLRGLSMSVPLIRAT